MTVPCHSFCKRLLISIFLCVAAGGVAAQPFSFVALGDLPYGQAAQGHAPYKSLIAAINLVFPKSAVPRADLELRYVPALLKLARAIGRGARPLLEATRVSR